MRLITGYLIASAMLATGCSGSHGQPAAGSSPASRSTTTSADPAAARLLSHAVAQTGALRSYTYSVTETVAAHRIVITTITGRVVRDHGVSYTIATGRTSTQVIRMGRTAWTRRLPGRWTRMRRSTTTADPTATLLTVLRALVHLSASGNSVNGALPPQAATAAHIPTDGRPADISATLDSAGRVIRLSVSTSTAAGARSVVITAVTSYTDFDHAAPIKAPSA